LSVRMLGSHSGISMGFYGTSHHATEDIGILRSMADLTLLAPIDAVSLRCAIEATVDHSGPIYFRLGRGREAPVYERPPEDWRIGGSAELRAGEDVAILATGNCVNAALGAADKLADEGIGVRVIDMYSLKPLDKATIERAASETRRIFTAEEHNVLGGLGSAVAEVLAESGSSTPLTRVGIPDEYSLLGPPTHLYRHYGIDAEGIASAVQRSLHGEPPQGREGG
jgi:transketolase